MKVKLGKISKVFTGYTFRKGIENDPEGEISVIQIKDTEGPVLDTENLTRVRSTEIKKYEPVSLGDILVKARGSREHIGDPIIIETLRRETVATSHFFVVRTQEKAGVYPKYLAWFLKQNPAQKQLFQAAEGSNINMLKIRQLAEMEILVPEKEIQKKIICIDDLRRRESDLLINLAEKRRIYINVILLHHAGKEMKTGK